MNGKEYNFENGKRGAVAPTPGNKTQITIRVDTDILNWFRNQVHKAGGGNYQTLINEVLRGYIEQRNATFERTLRRIIREELQTKTAGKRTSKKSHNKQRITAQ